LSHREANLSAQNRAPLLNLHTLFARFLKQLKEDA